MAAASVAVTSPAHAPALTRSSAWRAATGRDCVHATSLGRKARWLATRSSSAVAGQQEEAWPDHAELIAEHAEQQRGKEAPESAKGADETRDRAGVFREVFRHQLEDGAVAESHQHRASEGADREGHHGRPREEEREQRHAAEDPREDLRAADPVGQPAAHGPHQRGEDDESGRAKSRVRRREAELRAQQRGQVNRERDEAAEGQEVEGAEQPGGGRAPKDRRHRGEGARAARLRRIPRQQEVRHGPGQEQCARAAEHHLPAKPCRHDRADEHRQRLPHRPQAIHAEGRALAGGGRPAGDEGRADRERRPSHADQERRDQERAVAAGQRHDKGGQRGEGEERREHEASAEAIRQDAHRQPRQ